MPTPCSRELYNRVVKSGPMFAWAIKELEKEGEIVVEDEQGGKVAAVVA